MDMIVAAMEQPNAEYGVDPNDLLIFARVAELGSFSRAAERLGLPKSTVSRRLAALEQRMGERLLLRTTRRQTVTEFGLQLLEHARQVVAEMDAVSVLREQRQAAKLRILVDGKERLPELICDGILISTPAGSTAYNLSAHGPIVPLDARLLPLTPISAFRPRRWRGALLPSSARVVFEVLEPDKRPVSATADYTEVRDVRRVEVREDRSITMTMLFDPDRSLSERIIAEQFTT